MFLIFLDQLDPLSDRPVPPYPESPADLASLGYSQPFGFGYIVNRLGQDDPLPLRLADSSRPKIG